MEMGCQEIHNVSNSSLRPLLVQLENITGGIAQNSFDLNLFLLKLVLLLLPANNERGG